MPNYIALKNHSFYSFLRSSSSPENISVRLNEIQAKSAILTDYNSLSGVPTFIKSINEGCKNCGYLAERHEDNKGKCLLKNINCPNYEKSNKKAIIGLKLNIENGYIHLLTKNLNGWKNLIELFSDANKPENYIDKPQSIFEKISKYKDLIVYSGEPNSQLANFVFNSNLAYHAKTYDEAKSFVKDQSILRKDLLKLTDDYKQIFKDNFFIGIQLIDKERMPVVSVLANIFRWVAKQLNIKCIALPDPHYCNEYLAFDQRILLCSEMDSTLSEVDRKINKFPHLEKFFKSNKYHIPSYNEMNSCGHSEEELNNTLLIDEMCESYNIFGKPQLPKFDCPNNKSSDEYLRELCIDGWKRKIQPIINKDKSKKEEYANRIKEELEILCGAKLADYFLIVQDFNKYAQEKLNCPKDPGRGSGSSSLVGYLLDIHNTNPIEYDLLFSRFYDQSRNDPKTGKFSLPDYDLDYPPSARDGIIEYIKQKYGKDKVCQMATLSELKGREALSTVFRVHNWGNFLERKEITSFIAQKDKISDDLQESMEETGESSIIMWSLENNSKDLKQFCEIKEDGNLDGPLAKYFEQAIRLEGTKKSQGRHPSGIIISPLPISQICPMIYDKSTKEMITAFDMYSAEPTGLVKFDILGTNVNQKIVDAFKFVKYGKVA